MLFRVHLTWILPFFCAQTACTMLGYDAALDGSPDEQTRLDDGDPSDVDAGADERGDGGGVRSATGDGSLASAQNPDGGSAGQDGGSFDVCSLSSWLPSLIPDLSVIPNIPGITSACAVGDAGSRDAGVHDAGASTDAGKVDAGNQAGGDAATDASTSDASTSDASTSDASTSDASASDASSSDASTALPDAAQDASASDASTTQPAADAGSADAATLPPAF